MATIDELLASGGETAKLTVNLASRKIVVPPGIKNIGVESDDDVMCLPFSMPRHFGDVDLSEFDIRINYKNARGEGDVYLVNEFITTDADMIEFDWIVGRYAVAYEGEVVFSLCLKKMDENNVVVKEFNTTICSLSVLKGLETDGAIIQENPDLINQMIEKSGAEARDYVDVVTGDMNAALDEIIALQEQYIKDSLPDITFYVYGNPYTAKEGQIWQDKLKTDTEFADTIGYFGAKDDTGIVWVSGDCFQLGLNGIPVLLTDTIVADAYYDGIYN